MTTLLSGGDGDRADADAVDAAGTPAAKRRRSSLAGKTPNAKTPNAAADAAAAGQTMSADGVCPIGEDGLKDLTAFAQADSHLELVLTVGLYKLNPVAP